MAVGRAVVVVSLLLFSFVGDSGIYHIEHRSLRTDDDDDNMSSVESAILEAISRIDGCLFYQNLQRASKLNSSFLAHREISLIDKDGTSWSRGCHNPKAAISTRTSIFHQGSS